MSTDGFHYTRSKNEVGYKVPGYKVEQSHPLLSGRVYGSWSYPEVVPESGISRNIYWFSYDDLIYLMDKPHDEVKRLARLDKWRSRLNNTTKERQFYLFDLLVGVWSYFLEWYGHKIDQELLEDAYERKRRLLP